MKYVLGIRTDTAEASVVLFEKPSGEIIDHIDWTAGRQLSATLLTTIQELLERNNAIWRELVGIVVYEGPGSFTGLRIGITVANTAAFSLNIPIMGATGDDWLAQGASKITFDHFGDIVTPAYGAEANISKPKH